MASAPPLLPTPTELAQAELDRALASHLLSATPGSGPRLLGLDRGAHVAFARRALETLPSGYSSLGASRPWLLHWATHSLSLLNAPLSDDPLDAESLRGAIVRFLRACQSREQGGFGGGPGQEPHLATTYAATATLVELGGKEALEACDREKLASFLLSCVVAERGEKEGIGTRGRGFRVCAGGEADVRGCFCALAASALLRLPAPADPGSLAEAAGLGSYLRDCQTVEGGLGGFPGGTEAHGGYAFCGAAAAALAAGQGGGGDDNGDARGSLLPSSSSPPLDARALLLWASRCQSPTCGGFAGRTNKLVDGCYSWWQGALFGMFCAGGGGEGADAAAAASAASVAPPPSFPAFDASWLPPLPPLPPLPAGVTRAPTATERAEQEAKAEAEAGGNPAAAVAAVEEARAAAGVRELLPLSPPAPAPHLCYDPLGIQMWVLAYCQEPSTELPSPSSSDGETEEEQRRRQRRQRRFRGGGLRDKPGKPPDHYHTCYCLSGLAAAQEAASVVIGGEGNRLEKTHFLLNVVAAKVSEAAAFFEKENRNAEEGEGKRRM